MLKVWLGVRFGAAGPFFYGFVKKLRVEVDNLGWFGYCCWF